MPTEMDINVPTPVYEHPEIKKLCEYWQPHVGLFFFFFFFKNTPGGFFLHTEILSPTELHSLE